MKKMMMAIAAMAMVGSSVLADQVEWANVGGDANPAVDRSGTVINGGTFIAQIVRDGGNGTMNTAWGVGDDVVTAMSSPIADGYWDVVFDPSTVGLTDGTLVYSRVLDNLASPTWYANSGVAGAGAATTFQAVQDSTIPAPTWNYFTVSPVAGDWVPVPEPATMALLGLGALTLGYRRKRK